MHARAAKSASLHDGTISGDGPGGRIRIEDKRLRLPALARYLAQTKLERPEEKERQHGAGPWREFARYGGTAHAA